MVMSGLEKVKKIACKKIVFESLNIFIKIFSLDFIL